MSYKNYRIVSPNTDPVPTYIAQDETYLTEIAAQQCLGDHYNVGTMVLVASTARVKVLLANGTWQELGASSGS